MYRVMETYVKLFINFLLWLGFFSEIFYFKP